MMMAGDEQIFGEEDVVIEQQAQNLINNEDRGTSADDTERSFVEAGVNEEMYNANDDNVGAYSPGDTWGSPIGSGGREGTSIVAADNENINFPGDIWGSTIGSGDRGGMTIGDAGNDNMMTTQGGNDGRDIVYVTRKAKTNAGGVRRSKLELLIMRCLRLAAVRTCSSWGT